MMMSYFLELQRTYRITIIMSNERSSEVHVPAPRKLAVPKGDLFELGERKRFTLLSSVFYTLPEPTAKSTTPPSFDGNPTTFH